MVQLDLSLSFEDLALDVFFVLLLLLELLSELVDLLLVIVELHDQVDLLLVKLDHVLLHFLVFDERAVQFVGNLLDFHVLGFKLTLFLGDFRFLFLFSLAQLLEFLLLFFEHIFLFLNLLLFFLRDFHLLDELILSG